MSAAEQSSSAGGLVQDNLQLLDGGFPIVFGCETRETGEIFLQEADGIMGLGKSEISVVNQVRSCSAFRQCFLSPVIFIYAFVTHVCSSGAGLR